MPPTQTVSVSLTPSLIATVSGTNIDPGAIVGFGGSIRHPLNAAPIVFGPGTGAKQVTQFWSDAQAFTGQTTFNLTNLMIQSFGNTNNFTGTGVKIILVVHQGSAGPLTLFGAPSNPWNAGLTGTTPKWVLNPGESFLQYSLVAGGWPVTATAQNLLIDAGSNSINALVALFG